MKSLCLLSILPLLPSLVGCGFKSVDLSGKECPCAPGFECDDATGLCVSSTGNCEPLVTATSFRARWSTANVVWWDWEPLGNRDDFVRYELHVAERPEDLGTDRAIVFGPDDNPELGGFVLQRTRGADDIVTSTMTHDLEPNRTYAARLVAIDSAFCEFQSEVAAVSTTLDPPAEIVIFRDDITGSPFPRTISAVDGTLEHVPDMDVECVMSGDTVCSQNLRLISLGLGLSHISPGEFANTAFVEVSVSTDAAVHSFFSRVWLGFDAGGTFQIEPFTIRANGEARVMQFPLTELANAGTLLEHAVATSSPLEQFNLGGQWARRTPDDQPARVRLDEIRIRY